MPTSKTNPKSAIRDPQFNYESQLFRLRQRTTRYLAFALAQASRRLARASTGHRVFSDPLDLDNCHFIVRILPTIFDHLPDTAPTPPSNPDPNHDHLLRRLIRQHAIDRNLIPESAE